MVSIPSTTTTEAATTTNSQVLRFHFDWRDHWLNANDVERTSRDIMHQSAGRMMNVQNYFNDYPLYKWLKSTKGCNRVDLAKVLVFHNDFVVFGLQSVYRVTYWNGISREIAAEKHVYTSGFYTQGQPPKVTMLELESEEFITNVYTRQGEVVDNVTFVTNQRRVSLGGPGGMAQPDLPEHFDGVMSKIVAFTGTKAGCLERLGYFLEPVNWEEIKHIVLMRKLLESGRSKTNHYAAHHTNKEQKIVHRLLSQSNDDVLRKVLGYLIFSKESMQKKAHLEDTQMQ